MEMLDKRVRTHLAKTAEYFQNMEGGMPSVQERLATLNEASENLVSDRASQNVNVHHVGILT